MSVGFAQSVEGLKRIEPDLTPARGILPADRLWTWTQLFPESLSCQPTPLDFGPASSHSLMNQFLKISLSLHLNIRVMLINMKMPSKEGLQCSMFPTVSVYDIIDPLPTVSFRASPENCLGGRERQSPWESWMVGTSAFESGVESPLRTRELGAKNQLWLAWPYSLVLSSEGESHLLTSVYLKT